MGSKYLKYAKNMTTYFGASLIPMALSLLSNPWIAKNMSPEDYAISGYYLSFSALISPIIIFYLVHYYIKEYFRRDEAGRQRLFAIIAKALIWFSGIVSILCFIALYIYLKWFNADLSLPISPYLALMVFALPLTGLYSLQQSKFRMEKNSVAFFWLSLFNSIVSLALILLFVVILKWGAFGKLLGPLVGNSVIFLLLIYRFREILHIKVPFSEYFTILKFCFPLALSAMLGYFTHGFSTTYLESLGDNTEYGIYIVGNSLGTYLTVFATAINSTFQPDLYETTIKRQWSRYAKFCSLQIIIVMLVALIFVVFAPFIISLLTAGRYDASTPYAQIVSLSIITSTIYYLINNYSIATNRPRLYLYTSIGGSIFIIIGMPFAVSHWSYFGGAWMTVISYIIFAIINLLLLSAFKKRVQEETCNK